MRRAERTMTTITNARSPIGGIAWLLRVPIDPLTYRSLGYLLVSMPLGLAYFILLTVGISLSLGFSVLLVGPLFLVATLLLVIGAAWLDGALTSALLDAEVDLPFPSNDNVRVFLRELFLGRSTWFGLVYLVWKMMLGLFASIVLLVGLSVAASLALAPMYYGEHVVLSYGLGRSAIDTFSAAIAVAAVGALVGYLVLLTVNVLGILSRAVAEGLLNQSAA